MRSPRGVVPFDRAVIALHQTTQHVRNLRANITHQGDGLTMVAFGPVCIAIWNAQPTRTLFEVQRSSLASAVLKAPGEALFLCVVASDARPPEQDIRDASSAMITGHGKSLAGCACVIEGSGFRAAITRTVLSGIVLITRTPSPVVFFDSVASALPWLQKRSTRVDLQGLAEALDEARPRVAPVVE
jgi:hypothetical protein